MAFNPSKCETITVTRKKSPHIPPYILKNEELGTTKTVNYLGPSAWLQQQTSAGIVTYRERLPKEIVRLDSLGRKFERPAAEPKKKPTCSMFYLL